jgi:hypothetical protein
MSGKPAGEEYKVEDQLPYGSMSKYFFEIRAYVPSLSIEAIASLRARLHADLFERDPPRNRGGGITQSTY